MAISFSSDYTHGSSGSGASPTLTYVAPSTPSKIFVTITIPSTETCTATYNGVSLVEINHTSNAGGSTNRLYLWSLDNPTAGSHTVQFSKSSTGSCDFAAWSYTDASATGVGTDQQNIFSGASTISETLTPTTTGMWMVTVNTHSGPDSTVNSNCTIRSGVSAQRDLGVFDSNGSLTGGVANTQIQNFNSAGGEAVSATFDIKSVTLIDNIEAYWKLNGNSNDSVGSDNGTDVNVTYGPGIISQGAVFNGVAQINLAPDGYLYNFSPFSVSLWINTTKVSPPNDMQIFADYAFDGSQNYGWTISMDGTTSVVKFTCFNLNIPTYAISPGSYNDGLWHNIVVVRNLTDNILYIDGQQVASTPFFITINNLPTQYPTIGAQQYDAGLTNQFFYGTIDEIGIWSRELTPTEVAQLYNNGVGLTYPFIPSIVGPFPTHFRV